MPRKKKGKDAWSVIALCVGLMSGIASIVREWLGIFMPTVAPPSRLFEACGVTCFIVSVWVLVYRKDVRIRELENRTPERYARMVDDAVTRHGDSVILLLRHLAVLGSVPFGMAHSPSLPVGMSAVDTVTLLVALKSENLVYDEPVPVDMCSPLQIAIRPSVWRVSPGIEPFLDEILAEYE
jgi:hypothetical protein